MSRSARWKIKKEKIFLKDDLFFRLTFLLLKILCWLVPWHLTAAEDVKRPRWVCNAVNASLDRPKLSLRRRERKKEVRKRRILFVFSLVLYLVHFECSLKHKNHYQTKVLFFLPPISKKDHSLSRQIMWKKAKTNKVFTNEIMKNKKKIGNTANRVEVGKRGEEDNRQQEVGGRK